MWLHQPEGHEGHICAADLMPVKRKLNRKFIKRHRLRIHPLIVDRILDPVKLLPQFFGRARKAEERSKEVKQLRRGRAVKGLLRLALFHKVAAFDLHIFVAVNLHQNDLAVFDCHFQVMHLPSVPVAAGSCLRRIFSNI